MGVIEIKNLYKKYDDNEILRDINLTIEQGEFVSIIGKSGSGKSTLLYVMSGLELETSGTVLINGSRLEKMRERSISRFRSREMGFIFQFYNLVPNLSVEDNILLPIFFGGRKCRPNKDNLNEILEYVGLAEKKKALPRNLSGGQQQKVAIARALINKPHIVFADEPTGNLDSTSGIDVMELLAKINREQNTTIIQVSHNNDMINYGQRIVHISDGEVAEQYKKGER